MLKQYWELAKSVNMMLTRGKAVPPGGGNAIVNYMQFAIHVNIPLKEGELPLMWMTNDEAGECYEKYIANGGSGDFSSFIESAADTVFDLSTHEPVFTTVAEFIPRIEGMEKLKLPWYIEMSRKLDISKHELAVRARKMFFEKAEGLHIIPRVLLDEVFYEAIFERARSPLHPLDVYRLINPYRDEFTVDGDDLAFAEILVQYVEDDGGDILEVIDNMYRGKSGVVFEEVISLSKSDLLDLVFQVRKRMARNKILRGTLWAQYGI